jgi:cytochrome c oxidase assembly protein subunit 15
LNYDISSRTLQDKKTNIQVATWLLSGCFLIFAMVVIGGITRLTGSGLSITEWNVIMGALPPLNEYQWQEAFEKYQQIPQFQRLNYDFTLQDFKGIFFWEYLHRLIGRLIGVVFIVPFVYFLIKKKLDAEWIKKSAFLFALGGLQGFLGWFMVKSGLTERTSVSHYRLAIHLITAFITFGFTFWFALQLLYKREGRLSSKVSSLLRYILALVTIQIIYGAFVSGLHAGKIANTFPTMDGEWIPSGITAMSPAYLNFFENPLTVQFIHRGLAIIIVLLIFYFGIKSRAEALSKQQQFTVKLCMIAVSVQFTLGLMTLLWKVPVALAALHQIGGFFLFTSVLSALYFSYNRTSKPMDVIQ